MARSLYPNFNLKPIENCRIAQWVPHLFMQHCPVHNNLFLRICTWSLVNVLVDLGYLCNQFNLIHSPKMTLLNVSCPSRAQPNTIVVTDINAGKNGQTVCQWIFLSLLHLKPKFQRSM